MNDNQKRCFNLIDISPSATFDEAKTAYRQLVQVWHPDKHAHNEKLQAKATGKIKEINAAWLEVEAYFKSGGAEAPKAEHRTNEKNESSQNSEQVLPTYTDQKSGLMWARNGNIPGKPMNWFDATNWVKNLNYGGYADWRLPELGDYDSLPTRCDATLLNSSGFNNIQSGIYWTGSSYKDDDSFASYIDMRGTVGTGIKTHDFHVLPVRAGQFKDDATREAEAREAERQANDYLRQTKEEPKSIKVSLSSVNNGSVRCPVCNSNQSLSKENIIYCVFKCTECKSEVNIVYNPNETDKQSSETDKQSSVIFRPLAQQSVAENIIRGLIACTILGFILRGCT
jgi:hypothetical protein